MKGVLGAVPQSGDRYQVVIGGAVATMYENIMHLPEMAGVGAGKGAVAGDKAQSDADVKAAERAKVRGKVAWMDSFFEYLSDSFRPILGVLLGASIIIALVNLCISIGIVPSEEANTSLVFIKAIWKGVFYFLPIMIAYNASKKLKVDPWLGGSIMAALMTPQFADLMDSKKWKDVTTCVKSATLGTTSCSTKVFGIPMLLNDYSGNVFVPLLMAAVLALVYHGLKKIVPDSVQIVFVPFFSMIIVGALTAFLIGPLGIRAGNWLGVGLAWINGHAPFIFAIIIPMLYPFLVPLGLHWPLNALMLMNIQTLGYDFIQGPMGVWNFACFGATAGVLFIAIRDKNKDMRQTALGALAAGLLGGVSEPSLYGIHLRYKLVYKRMLAGCGRWRRHCRPRLALPVRHRRRPDRAWCDHHRLRLHLAADHSGLQPDVGVRGLHRGLVHGLDLADHQLDYRTPEQKAEMASAASDLTADRRSKPRKAPARRCTGGDRHRDRSYGPPPFATTMVGAPVAGHVDRSTKPAIRCSPPARSAKVWASSRLIPPRSCAGLRRAADRGRDRSRLRPQDRRRHRSAGARRHRHGEDERRGLPRCRQRQPARERGRHAGDRRL